MVELTSPLGQSYKADFFFTGEAGKEAGPGGVALMAAEVINLSRNIVITGDDFENVACDPR